MRLHLCGVRGSTPAPGADFVRYGGHTSCIAVYHDGAEAPTLILDAGTGLRAATTLLHGRAFAGTILLTHLHWDHFQGLPFFAAGDNPDSRISLFLPEQADGSTATAVLERSMSPPHFPMVPEDLRGDWTFATIAPGEWQAEGFSVMAREVPHKGGRTFGYRISDGRSTLTYIPDHCPTAFGPGPDGLGEYHPVAIELAADTDLLVHDAQLFPAEVAADAQYGHAAADYGVALGALAGARSVTMFHHRPDRTDAALDELAARFSGEPGVSVARQDTVIDL